MAEENEIDSLKKEIKQLHEQIAYLENVLDETDMEIINQDLAFNELSQEYKKFVKNKGVSIDDGIFLSL